MKRKYIKKLIALILLGATLFAGGYLTRSINTPNQPTTKIEVSTTSRQEVVCGELQQMNKLIYCDVPLNQQVLFIEGVQNKAFKNNVLIDFRADTYITIDMNKLTKDNVHIDEVNKTVKVYAPKPEAIVEFKELTDASYIYDKGTFPKLMDVKHEIEPQKYEEEKHKVEHDFRETVEAKYNDTRLLLQKAIQDNLFRLTGQKYIVTVQFVF